MVIHEVFLGVHVVSYINEIFVFCVENAVHGSYQQEN